MVSCLFGFAGEPMFIVAATIILAVVSAIIMGNQAESKTSI